MKYQPGLLDPFISPVSGKLRSYSQFPLMEEDYILVGDVDGSVYQSPALIDLKLQVIDILSNLSQSSFILQTAHDGLDRAQALDQLKDGILKHKNGIIDIAAPDQDFLSSDLTYKNLLIGDIDNKAKPRTTIYNDNLPDLQAVTLQIGPVTYGIWEMWQGTNPGRPEASYSVSTTLAQIDFAFKRTNWIIGKSGIVPGAISYPGAQFIDQLPSDRMLTHVGDGVIGVASLTFKSIWRGDESGVYKETQDLTILEDKVTFIENVKIPAIESEIESIQGEITAIQGQITVIEGEIALLEGSVVVLQGQVAGLLASVASLSGRVSALESKVSTLESNVSSIQAQIIIIQGQIAAINTRIDNLSASFMGDVQGAGLLSNPINLELMLTLDQIKKARGTVDLNNNKITNLNSDNVEQLDALNAKFLWDLMHDEVGVVWA